MILSWDDSGCVVDSVDRSTTNAVADVLRIHRFEGDGHPTMEEEIPVYSNRKARTSYIVLMIMGSAKGRFPLSFVVTNPYFTHTQCRNLTVRQACIVERFLLSVLRVQ